MRTGFGICAAVCALSVSMDPASAQDQGWPRSIEHNNNEVVVFQPQIDEWQDHKRVTARAAVAVTPAGAAEAVYGALYFSAETETDFEGRTVLIKERKLTDFRFPNSSDQEEARLKKIFEEALPPQEPLLVSLDRVIAYLEASEKQVEGVQANLNPPPIFYSDKPAVLLMFMGEPRFEPVEETNLLFAVNTNWDLFLDSSSGKYYLLNEDHWATTSDVLKGPWSPTTDLPKELSKLPDNDNWTDVRPHIRNSKKAKLPVFFASAEPAELIQTEGKPSYTPISGTPLLYVSNSNSDVFLHASEENHYFLTAGRWFRSKKIVGPWSAATLNLPEAFAQIPPKHPKGFVLASVSGTPEAEDAVLLAAVPRRVTVNKSDLSLDVPYDGAPQFQTIPETTVQYAMNTPYDVFLVEKAYYSCHQGVWFQATTANGAWVVCTKVPDVIYTIPPSSPKHNVTYVYVYDSTPDVVVVGHTSGYTGQYVVGGLVMFGLGVWALDEIYDDHWHHYHYHSHFYSYGCGARYDHYHGGYYRGAVAYGPYGGAGRAAAYNPRTGTYSRGAYAYGPRGGAFAREAYNPYTNRYAAQAGASNVYGSWGRSVVATDDGWARAGHRSNSRGTVAGVETSRGAAAVRGSTRSGSTTVARDKHGDVYVGRDGNVYKPSDSGQWQRYNNGDWNNTNLDSGAARTRAQDARDSGQFDRSNVNRSQSRTRSSTRSSTSGSGLGSGLNSDARSRLRGSSRAGELSSRRSGGGRAGGGRSRR